MASGPQPASIEDALASFDSVPLFMKSLPQEDTDDTVLSALQSLVHDGTPDGRSILLSRLNSSSESPKRSRKISRNKEMIILKADDTVKRWDFIPKA